MRTVRRPDRAAGEIVLRSYSLKLGGRGRAGNSAAVLSLAFDDFSGAQLPVAALLRVALVGRAFASGLVTLANHFSARARLPTGELRSFAQA